jgi:MFS family permease
VLAAAVMLPVTLPVPVLRELVQRRFEVSELATSLFMSINMVGAALAAPLAGAFADRFGRRRELVVGALLADALAFAALRAPVGFPLFLAIRFLEGCAHIAALSLLLATASHARPEAQRGRTLGLVGGGMMLGVALGAPLGGWLGRADPLRPLLAAAALALAASVLAALGLREAGGSGRRPPLRELVRTVRAHGALAVPLAYSFVDRFTVGFFTTTLSLFLSRIHTLSPARIGLLITGFMIPFALLSYPFGRIAERRSRVALVCGGSTLYGLGTASLTLWPAGALPAVMPAVGIFAAVMFVPSLLLTVELAPAAVRSTAIGAFNAAGSLGFILGPLAGGLVSESVAASSGWQAGYTAAFAVAGASELLCVAATLPWLLRLARAGRVE